MTKNSGRGTRDRVEKFPASDGHISCQNPRPLSSLETGRYDLQVITFQTFEKDDVMAQSETSPEEVSVSSPSVIYFTTESENRSTSRIDGYYLVG